jgi:hypothetical protein
LMGCWLKGPYDTHARVMHARVMHARVTHAR